MTEALQSEPGEATQEPSSPYSPQRAISIDDDDASLLASKSKPKASALKEVLGRMQASRPQIERANSDPTDSEEAPSPPLAGLQSSQELLLDNGAQRSLAAPSHRRSSTCDGRLLGACINKRALMRNATSVSSELPVNMPELRKRMESVLDVTDMDAFRQQQAACGTTTPPTEELAPSDEADNETADAAGSPMSSPSEPVARRLPPTQLVASIDQETALSVRKFNEKATAGVQYLLARKLLAETPEAVANYLRTTKGLSKRRIGEYLGERSDFIAKVLSAYTANFHFGGMQFVEAIRSFLSPFRLPGEAQKIDRIMCEFARQYCLQNPGVFADEDAAYVLGFSVIMLNTDAHSSQVKNKMTREQFLRNNRGINRGGDLPAELLEGVYNDIANNEIKTGTEFDDLAESELMNWLRQGTVFQKYAHGHLSTAPYHPCRVWIRDNNTLCYCNVQQRGRREKTVPLDEIEEIIIGGDSDVFRRNGVAAQSSEGALCFSLVFGGRTLDLQATTPDEVSIWTRYFSQVIERTQLEAHMRSVALRAQPRELFLESSVAVWRDEILTNWAAERSAKRTMFLWWEGVPSVLRGDVWRLAIGDPLKLGPNSFAAHCEAVSAEDKQAAQGLVARELQAVGAVALELNLFTSEHSPMQLSLLQLLAASRSYARASNADLPACSSFLGAMLLLYLDAKDAFVCLCTMVSLHHLGWRHNEEEWRLRCAAAMLRRELPELMAHLANLGVELSDFLPTWVNSVLLSTLPLDVTARVWDCYLRDGEPFLWRAVLELLRLLAPLIIDTTDRDSCFAILQHARHASTFSDKALFHSIASNEAAMQDWLKDFSQKLPMPSADRGGGTCFDMWRNSTLAGLDNNALQDDDDNEGDIAEMEARWEPPCPKAIASPSFTSPPQQSADHAKRKGTLTRRGQTEPVPCSSAFT